MTVSHTSVLTPMAAELPPGVDDSTIVEINADLAAGHVATLTGRDKDELAAIAADARAHGISLSIVVVPGNPAHDSSLRDLATEVGKTQHGTVVVFSADQVGTWSDSINRARLEWAEDSAKFKGGDSAQSAQIFVDRLESPGGTPWTAITGVLLAGTVLAVGGLYYLKARRRSEEAARVGVSAAAESGANAS
ncbi:DUF6676 family protein [Nocardia arthritidis]|uniref:TPM domain-containing protein n=1 Tax=Nocardia arthritidis TaxID=228602 RepID=A0A6G9YJE9_9NOCA|nr:DUF6676 family protein [Nocardia arthritidis]QIS13321.1 hypothetical protein F5544_27335 [Nocardia arthritidis]